MNRKTKPKPTMTISNSRTWIKLNQIDCERRFYLNWLRKSFVAMTFDHINTCTVPKSRINEHFYSQCSVCYLSSSQSHIIPSAALILILFCYLSCSWNTINAYGWFRIRLLLMKKKIPHNISNTLTKKLILNIKLVLTDWITHPRWYK